ncbi:hypothetical protein [Mycolicibacterium palauense]|uniref:hypothetical protein n=1 Tax=Mycolicibacterium palauense TaxID=2034511 RepID=UPI0011453949|nr:hypothetical protein [Mycolicibacterium palauense]
MEVTASVPDLADRFAAHYRDAGHAFAAAYSVDGFWAMKGRLMAGIAGEAIPYVEEVAKGE